MGAFGVSVSGGSFVKQFFVLVAGLLLFGCAQPQDGVGGATVSLKGSDTELQMFAALAEEFMKSHPDVSVTVTGGGSGTGIAALINGEIDVADSSRKMKDEEIKKAEAHGVEPVEFIVARDGLAVIVHPDNPVTDLTVAQVADIYTGKVTNWNQVGGADAPITLYGRQSTSGTYLYFRDTVLKADYSPHMRNLEGTAAIVASVSQDKNGIGYVGLGYVTDAIQVVSLEGVSPLDKQSVTSGRYVLTRPLYQYSKVLPAKDSGVHALLLFELSDAGQAVVEQTGFLGITDADRAANQAHLNRVS